jgi:hypothetical protein
MRSIVGARNTKAKSLLRGTRENGHSTALDPARLPVRAFGTKNQIRDILHDSFQRNRQIAIYLPSVTCLTGKSQAFYVNIQVFRFGTPRLFMRRQDQK